MHGFRNQPHDLHMALVLQTWTVVWSTSAFVQKKIHAAARDVNFVAMQLTPYTFKLVLLFHNMCVVCHISYVNTGKQP